MLGRTASAGAPLRAVARSRSAARAGPVRGRGRELLPGAASLALLASGAGALAGWALKMPALGPALPGLALWFVLAGLALWIGRHRHALIARAAAASCAGLAALLGAAALLEHGLGRSLGIPSLLVLASTARGVPLRLGMVAALEATLAGVAIALLPVRTRAGRRPATWLALLVLIIAVAAAAEHLYHAVAAFPQRPAVVLPVLALFVLVAVAGAGRAAPAPPVAIDSLALLAAGIGHDINNPLAVVLANVDMALHDLERVGAPGLDRARAELRDARDGAERVSRIVSDLRLFSRPLDGAPAAVDLNAVLDTCLRLVLNQIRHRARVVTDYGSLPPVLANQSHLAQLLLERLVTAAQQLPEGAGEQPEVRLATSLRPDGQVLVEVAGASLVLPPAPTH